MATERTKDPERVRLGRLGALSVHARGRTNVGPAREASLASLALEFGITDELVPVERERRMQAALRVRMTRLAMARWSKRQTGTRAQGLLLVSRVGSSDPNPPAA